MFVIRALLLEKSCGNVMVPKLEINGITCILRKSFSITSQLVKEAFQLDRIKVFFIIFESFARTQMFLISKMVFEFLSEN